MYLGGYLYSFLIQWPEIFVLVSAFMVPWLFPLQICEAFKAISRKIYEKPNSIEELAELREWMKGIPEKLKAQEVRETFGSCESLGVASVEVIITLLH